VDLDSFFGVPAFLFEWELKLKLQVALIIRNSNEFPEAATADQSYRFFLQKSVKEMLAALGGNSGSGSQAA
jgi:hypothetical protein